MNVCEECGASGRMLVKAVVEGKVRWVCVDCRAALVGEDTDEEA